MIMIMITCFNYDYDYDYEADNNDSFTSQKLVKRIIDPYDPLIKHAKQSVQEYLPTTDRSARLQ